MRKYEVPEMKVAMFEKADVVTCSGAKDNALSITEHNTNKTIVEK